MAKPLTRKQLYDLVWQKPMMVIAKEYGLSDKGLAKLCERNGIPVPPRGYWAKKAAGHKVSKPPLVMPEAQEAETILLLRKATPVIKNIEITEALPQEIQDAINRESLPKNQITVPQTLHNPHVIIAHWIKEDDESWENSRRWGLGDKSPKTTPLHQRQRRILSALLKALEARGFALETDRTYTRRICIEHERYKLHVHIEEYIRRQRRELTRQEKIERSWGQQKWAIERENTDQLVLKISSDHRRHLYKKFSDTEDHLLEAQLNKVIVGIIEQLWELKKQRLESEAYQRRWQEEQQRQRKIEEAQAIEKQRKEDLETKAFNWKKAAGIREYVAAVESTFKQGTLKVGSEEFNTWKMWALAHADALDPITRDLQIIGLITD